MRFDGESDLSVIKQVMERAGRLQKQPKGADTPRCHERTSDEVAFVSAKKLHLNASQRLLRIVVPKSGNQFKTSGSLISKLTSSLVSYDMKSTLDN